MSEAADLTDDDTEEVSSLRALTNFVTAHVREQRELAVSTLVPQGTSYSQEQLAQFLASTGAKRLALLKRLEELWNDIWLEGYAAAADDINAIRTGTLTDEQRTAYVSGAKLKALCVGLGLDPRSDPRLYEIVYRSTLAS